MYPGITRRWPPSPPNRVSGQSASGNEQVDTIGTLEKRERDITRISSVDRGLESISEIELSFDIVPRRRRPTYLIRLKTQTLPLTTFLHLRDCRELAVRLASPRSERDRTSLEGDAADSKDTWRDLTWESASELLTRPISSAPEPTSLRPPARSFCTPSDW